MDGDDDSAYGCEGDDSRSLSSMSQAELEDYLYSQIHYQQDDDVENSCVDKALSPSVLDVSANESMSHIAPSNIEKRNRSKFVAISSSDSESEEEVLCSAGKKSKSLSPSSSALSSDSENENCKMQFNTGASLVSLMASNNSPYHPLMSVRQQQSLNSYTAPKKRYFQLEKDISKVGSVQSLVDTFTKDNNAEFHCYLCGDTSHMSTMCLIKQKDRPRRGHIFNNFTRNKSDNECTVCSTCGRKDHHPRSWLIRGPPKLLCPNLRCATCGLAGHKLTECDTYSSVRGRICLRCGIPGHLQNGCPDQWRMYHATVERSAIGRPVSKQGEVTINDRRYCYICGYRGHFGFECTWNHRPTMARYVKSPFISTFDESQTVWCVDDLQNEFPYCEDSSGAIVIKDDGDEEEGEDFDQQQKEQQFWDTYYETTSKQPSKIPKLTHEPGSSFDHRHSQPAAKFDKFQRRPEKKMVPKRGAAAYKNSNFREEARHERWRKSGHELDDDFNRYNTNWGRGKSRMTTKNKRRRGPKSPKSRERARRKITFA